MYLIIKRKGCQECRAGAGGGFRPRDKGSGAGQRAGCERARGSGALDDDDGLVVDEGFVPFETKLFVLQQGVLHERIADVAGGLLVVFLQDGFERLAAGGIAAVVHAVGVRRLRRFMEK